MGMKKVCKLLGISLILVVIVSGSLFAAGAEESQAKEEVATIKIWQHLDNPDDPYFYNLIDRFNEQHPNIKAEFELIPWGGAFDLYTTSLVVGDAADVIFYATPTWGSAFWDMGVLEPLDDYIADWDKADLVEDSAWSSSRVSANDPVFGIPVVSLPGVVYYRKDWFKQLNIEVPETKEEFLAAAKKITENIPNAYGFGMRGARGGTGQMLSFILPAVGNKWFDENGNSTFRKPEAIAAAEWYINLHKTARVTPPSAPSDGFAEIMDGFRSGLTGMIVHHIMSANAHVEALGEDKVGIMYIPEVGGNRWVEAGLHHYIIPKASKNKEAAFTFASWMAEPEQAAYYGHYIGSIPVVKGAAEADSYFKESEFAMTSVESTAWAYNPPYIDTLGTFWEQVWPARTQQALLGEITPAQMMNYFADALEGK